MKKFKKIHIVLIALLAIALAYLSLCVYVSVKVNKSINAAYETFGEVNNAPQFIDDLHFEQLSYRCQADTSIKSNLEDYYENNSRTFPICLIWFNKAYTRHWYTYECHNAQTDRLICGSSQIPVTVTVEFSNWRWRVVKVDEPV